MAKHTQVILIDDLDGGEANETVTFALDGTSYEIDLSDSNAKKLREAVLPFVNGARRAESTPSRGRRRGGGGSQRAMTREKSAEIRAWAKANNHPVSERGRIAASIVEAYEAAH
ncbi:Lsr2 family protein [Herbidospora sp. NEAU-GS84]|uniref:Lsr2 family protein n=1 Tax=Herbidospora solisilvae TaxID=2696284 RepID=A0A7C9J4P1_9ACTN|nr:MULTISPECIES: Lsr2 family protein [Herbidospora]NAS23720.1 Lsr2 family protein [Herbidospora solisilvae]GLX95255.1 Lsr2 family protein [Herbidospora sp. NBRC 101105]